MARGYFHSVDAHAPATAAIRAALLPGGIVPVGDPFEDIAGHVVQTVAVRLIASDANRTASIEVGVGRRDGVAQDEDNIRFFVGRRV